MRTKVVYVLLVQVSPVVRMNGIMLNQLALAKE